MNKNLIQEEQLEYQREMERKYRDFKQLLAPLISCIHNEDGKFSKD